VLYAGQILLTGTTGINYTHYHSCNYFACCLYNYSQIASLW